MLLTVCMKYVAGRWGGARRPSFGAACATTMVMQDRRKTEFDEWLILTPKAARDGANDLICSI
jgi:hypothetical protein